MAVGLLLGADPRAAMAQAAARQTALDLVGPRAWESYFPFRLGDSWTYEWVTEGPYAPASSPVRTRVFEGTSFVGASVGYTLVSDDGAYHLYTFDAGVLAIHSSSEAGRLLYYDPPVVLAAPDLGVGQARVVDHPDSGRQWRTTVEGLADVVVPLGVIRRALAIRLEMRGPDYQSTATHWFAPRVGLVAYKYALRDAAGETLLLGIDAKLKLARLGGRPVASLADVERLGAGPPAAVGEDRDLREALRRALGRRYTWDAQFPGFRGTIEYREDGRPPVQGEFAVAPDLSVRIEARDDGARATLRNEISSFITQRKESVFDLAYAETTFVRTATRPDGGVVIGAQGDPLATTYVVKDGEVVEVSRSVGRLSYVARDRAKVMTADGRTITVDYDVVFRSNQDGRDVAVERTRDAYERRGEAWVPVRRTVERTEGGRVTMREVTLTIRP